MVFIIREHLISVRIFARTSKEILIRKILKNVLIEYSICLIKDMKFIFDLTIIIVK